MLLSEKKQALALNPILHGIPHAHYLFCIHFLYFAMRSTASFPPNTVIWRTFGFYFTVLSNTQLCLFYSSTLGYNLMTFEFPSQKQEKKEGWEPSIASNLTLNFRLLIQPYSNWLLNSFYRGGWAWLSVSELESQKTSGAQKMPMAEFIYC